MGCDRMASCSDPTTHMLCVLGQVIHIFLTLAQRLGYMSFLKGLPVITIKFCTFFVKGVHFVHCLVQKPPVPTFLHQPSKKFLCHIWSFLCYEINHNVEEHWSLPSRSNYRESRKYSTSRSLFKTAGCSIQMVQY